MKITYFRELQKHHMVVKAGKYLCPDYQMEMLRYNEIPGILSPALRQMNETTEYDYGITGHQSLQTLVEAEPIGERLLSVLICSLCQVLEELERHLIDSQYLILRPEHIYLKREGGDIEAAKFCIFPFQEVKLEEQLAGLMKFVLDEVDYQDKRAVNLAYELFQLVSQEPVDFPKIKELIQSMKRQETETTAKIEMREEIRPETKIETKSELLMDKKMKQKDSEEILWLEEPRREPVKNRKGGRRFLRQKP